MSLKIFYTAILLTCVRFYGVDPSPSSVPGGSLRNWTKIEFVLLKAKERKPFSVTILIIDLPNIFESNYIEYCWNLSEKV
jgi:hypothetical protein